MTNLINCIIFFTPFYIMMFIAIVMINQVKIYNRFYRIKRLDFGGEDKSTKLFTILLVIILLIVFGDMWNRWISMLKM